MQKKRGPAVDAKELVQSAPDFFVSRMAGKRQTVRGVTFVLYSLTDLQFAYVQARGEANPELQALDTLRFGIHAIEGLNYEDGTPFPVEFEDVEIYGIKTKALSLDVLGLFPYEMKVPLAQTIQQLTAFGDTEKNKLDFTTPSLEPASARE